MKQSGMEQSEMEHELYVAIPSRYMQETCVVTIGIRSKKERIVTNRNLFNKSESVQESHLLI